MQVFRPKSVRLLLSSSSFSLLIIRFFALILSLARSTAFSKPLKANDFL
jgi:hypothetical protein